MHETFHFAQDLEAGSGVNWTMNSRVLGFWIRGCHGFYLVHPYGLGESMDSRMKPG